MNPLILQSDFGYADGAVCAMYGVAESICNNLHVHNLTHDIPQYDI
ncbi:MAG: SAM-dependent chlorinase/fluorinase [Ruthenibacterium sp.]